MQITLYQFVLIRNQITDLWTMQFVFTAFAKPTANFKIENHK